MSSQTKGYREHISNTIRALNKRAGALSRELSQKDLEQSDVLHYIEFAKVDAVGRTKLYNKLKQIRLERRDVKEEFARVQSARDRLKDVVAGEYTIRGYEPRVLQLDSIIGQRGEKGFHDTLI